MRKHGSRVPLNEEHELRIGSRALRGITRDIGLGGVFFATLEPARIGETGLIIRTDAPDGVAVRVAWLRGAGDPDGPPGLGLEFVSGGPDAPA